MMTTIITLLVACNKPQADVQESPTPQPPKKEGTIETGISYGYFQGIEFGDYLHIQFTDEKGDELSYWYLAGLNPDIDIDISSLYPEEAIPEKLKNKKLKIYWTKKNVYIWEAGEIIELDEITGLEYAKE